MHTILPNRHSGKEVTRLSNYTKMYFSGVKITFFIKILKYFCIVIKVDNGGDSTHYHADVYRTGRIMQEGGMQEEENRTSL